MNTKSLILVLSLFWISISCEKQDTDNPGVESYINLLKAGQYNSFDLPEFGSSDIPALLNFRNDTTSIINFPRNGISSYWQEKCKLGMFVLWTIESIRAIEIDSKYLIGRFPSQNPILALKDDPSKWALDDESFHIAAKAYHDWWNSIHLFTDKMKIDPLKNTDYKWH
jgi:hypothetical protein